jgi:hypothetical protein
VSSSDKMLSTHSKSGGHLSSPASVAERVARLADPVPSLTLNVRLFERLHAISNKVRLLATVHPRPANSQDARPLLLTTRQLARPLHDGFVAKLLRLAVARSATIANAISRDPIGSASHALSARSPQPRIATSSGIRRSDGATEARWLRSNKSPRRLDSTYLSQLVSRSIRSMHGLDRSAMTSSNRLRLEVSRFPSRALDSLSTGRNANGHKSYFDNIANHALIAGERRRFGTDRITSSRLCPNCRLSPVRRSGLGRGSYYKAGRHQMRP